MQQSPPSLLPLHSAAFELLPDPVLVVDQADMLLDANAAARALFGLAAPATGLPLPAALRVRRAGQDSATAAPVIIACGGAAQKYACTATLLRDAGMLLQLHRQAEPPAGRDAPREHPDESPLTVEAAMLRMGVALTSGLEMEPVLTTILDECRRLLPVDLLYIALCDRAEATYRFVLFWDQGIYRRSDAHYTPRTRRSLTSIVIERAATLHLDNVDDPATHRDYPAINIGNTATRSYLGTPLIVRGEVIGVLSIQHVTPNRYTTRHIQLLEAIASQAALAVENARLYALAQSELAERRQVAERLSLATQVASIGIWQAERASGRLYWDDRMYAIHGIAPGTSMTLERWRDLIAPEDLPSIEQIIHATYTDDTRATIEYRMRHPDGAIHHVVTIGGVLTDVNGKVLRQTGVSLDLTERKRMEEALRASEERYRLLVDNALDVIWTVDRNGHVAYVSPSVERQIGFKPKELIGQSFVGLLSPASAAAAEALLQRAVKRLADGLPMETWEFESTQVHKDGTLVHVHSLATPRFDAGDRFAGFQGVTRDISERKRVEAALQASEDRFRTMAEIAPVPMVLVRRDDGVVLYANPAATQASGYALEALVGTRADSYVTFTVPDRAVIKRMVGEGATVRGMEVQLVKADGGSVWGLLSLGVGTYLGEAAVLIVLNDITEHKRIEAALRESDRRWQFALEGAGDGVWDWDAVTNQVFYSRQWKAMLGYAEDEIGATLSEWQSRVHPEDWDVCNAALDDYLAGITNHYRCEHRVRAKDGSYRWILDRGMIIARTGDGIPSRLIGTHTDITARKQLEEAQRESELRYRLMVENMPDLLYATDATGLITYVSPSAQRICGYMPDELIGQTFDALIAPGSLADVQERLPRALAQARSARGDATHSMTLELIAKDGRPVWVETKTEARYEATGRFTGWIGVMRDITERQKLVQALADSEERFRLIVENLPDIISLYDEDGRLTYISPAVETLLGSSAAATLTEDTLAYERLALRSRVEPMPDDTTPAVADPNLAARRAVADAVAYCVRHPGERRRVETLHHLPTGGRRNLDTVYQAYRRSGASYQVVSITRDITEQRSYEALIKQANAELEQRVQERTEQLAATNLELTRANQLKDEFLGAVSHELRTPLMGILGIADAIQIQAGTLTEERQMRYAQILRRSGDRLLSVVNGILRYTSLLAGRRPIRREQCWPAEAAAIAMVRIRNPADAKRIHLVAPDLPATWMILSDAAALLDIMAELLSNAVKFTPEGGRVGLELTPYANGGLQITVWDTGCGIAPEARQRLFAPFVQGDGSLTRGFEGVGLGLAYVKRLVEALGGIVDLESEMQQGSRFTVRLP